jgi:minimal PKS acyl carrier protein
LSKMMSIDDLRGILVACAGGDEVDAVHGDISDVSFEDLGYDSLALMETAAKLGLEHGVVISDDEITEMRTPRELLDKINDQIVA